MDDLIQEWNASANTGEFCFIQCKLSVCLLFYHILTYRYC